MILSNNAFNWAMLRSGMGTGDFIASLTPEREEELFKQYNEWRRKRGLPEEEAIETPPPPEPRKKPTPQAASNNGNVSMVKGAMEDDISVLINEVAAEVEEEEAEEATLIQSALDGADEIVEEAEAASDEIAEEIEEETVAEEAETVPMDTGDEVDEAAALEVVTTPAVAADAVPEVDTASEVSTERSMDFAAVIRTLPKEADHALYSRIKAQFGGETKSMAEAALKEATAKHRATAAIKAFIAWMGQE